MKDQLPAPDFNGKKYERPNQKWVCGRLCEGTPCRNGPDGHGHCGAIADCKPAVQATEGSDKPTFVCTRSKELGGPCEEGPRSDGSCSHPPQRCQPQFNLRTKRGLLTKLVAACTIGVLLLMLFGECRWKFISPGELSLKHRSLAFTQKAQELHGAQQQCATCHAAGKSGPGNWLETAVSADPAPHQFQKLFFAPDPATTRIDISCQKCHPLHDFHEPNVAWEYSCSACHQEHRGGGPMAQPAVQHCTRCHGDKDVMLAASKKGGAMPTVAFNFQQDWTRASFKTPRPTNGFTQVISEFSKDHPEFLVHAADLKDPNTLRFSHDTHLGNNPKMTSLNGKPLDCAFCHQPGPGGVYYKTVTFENNCKVCHALQFDKENPELTIPHGQPAFVHAFLRSLPQQFADFATRNKKITTDAEVKRFVRERLSEMRQQYGPGEELEQKVFYSDERTAPASNVGGLGDQGRSLFPGCAYCHEVKRGVDLPLVTTPVMPERWLNRGRFDHSRHTALGCSSCHQAGSSKASSDVLIPSKQICASCHQPQGAARNDCFECHSYHHLRETPVLKTELRDSAKAL
jgi:predicted CXXCH cytochrome family protein